MRNPLLIGDSDTLFQLQFLSVLGPTLPPWILPGSRTVAFLNSKSIFYAAAWNCKGIGCSDSPLSAADGGNEGSGIAWLRREMEKGF